MKNVSNFDGKFFEIKLKNNWQLEEFLEFFEMSEEEFLSKLESTFSNKTCKGILRKLQRNSKKKIAENKKVTTDIEEIDSGENVEKSDEVMTVEGITQMIEQIEADKEKICEEQKKYLKKKNEALQSIEEAKKVLKDIQKAIQTQEKVIQSCTDKLTHLDSKLVEYNEEQEQLDEKIRELLEKKKELEKIVIRVSGDTIKCEVPVPENWRSMYNKITALEEPTDDESEKLLEVIEMMSIKSVRFLSKLFAIVDLIEKQQKDCKFVFDCETDISVALQMLDCFEVEVNY